MRWILALVAVAGCHEARAQSDAATELVGYANLPFALAGPVRGNARLTVRGTAEIYDACPDAGRRAFVSAYDGELDLEPDGSFTAPLATAAVVTPSGCAVTSMDVVAVTSVSIEASVPELGLAGQGFLTYQSLSDADNDSLHAGTFGELHARLVLQAVRR